MPDYILGSKGTAALYISLRYHLLNPNYLLGRLKELHTACVACLFPWGPPRRP